MRVALCPFALQFAFDVVWTPALFVLRDPGAALAVIVVLFVLAAATARAFARIDRRAGVLLVPYLAWVAFAGALNYAILTLNG